MGGQEVRIVFQSKMPANAYISLHLVHTELEDLKGKEVKNKMSHPTFGPSPR